MVSSALDQCHANPGSQAHLVVPTFQLHLCKVGERRLNVSHDSNIASRRPFEHK